MPASETTLLFGKVFKAKGIQNYLFLGDKNLCSQYEKSFQSSFLENEGVIAVFLNECVYQTTSNGSLILTNYKTINSNSYKDYISSSLYQYFAVFKAKSLSNPQIFSFFKNLPRVCNYSLINIQQSKKVLIGSIINGKINITQPILYYGGKNERSLFERPVITISANTGVENPPGFANAYQNAKFQQGTYFAVDKINRDHSVLPYHKLVLYDKVNCGVNVFVESYSKSCFLKNIKNMGIAYIPTTYPITPSVLKQLYTLNITIPFIAGTGSSTSLSNLTVFPNFVRMISPVNVFALA